MIFLIVHLRIRHAYLVGCRQRKLSFSNGTCCAVNILAYPPAPTFHNKKYTRRVYFLLWWVRVDSDHLRRSQQIYSLPRLSNSGAHPELIFMACHTKPWRSVVRAAGLEPAHQAWKACVLALVLCPR